MVWKKSGPYYIINYYLSLVSLLLYRQFPVKLQAIQRDVQRSLFQE